MRFADVAGLAIVMASSACTPNHARQGQPSSDVTSDTLLGVVLEVGADPATRVVLSRQGDADRVLSGDATRGLRAVLGAQVWMRGTAAADAFVVDEFEVRAVDGRPVDDGTVVREEAGGPIALVTRTGTRRALDISFERFVGARLWVTRPAAGRAPSFGLIQALSTRHP